MAFTSVLELQYEPQNIDLDTAKGKWVIEKYSFDGTGVTTGNITVGAGTIKTAQISGNLTGSYFRSWSGSTLSLTFPSGATGSVEVTLLRK